MRLVRFTLPDGKGVIHLNPEMITAVISVSSPSTLVAGSTAVDQKKCNILLATGQTQTVIGCNADEAADAIRDAPVIPGAD